jgi:3D-(3,5/4)-trihydroxycyclohexane-1,2-dione acylhydrolase (decyclizing)
MIVVEVLTPGGNWSSYPPHKHDEQREDEVELEEIYYFEIAGDDGLGYQRVYSSGPDRQIDVCAEVRGGDVVLVPYGYHGPSMAAPGYDLYYLNVMAGPAQERAWRFCDDPAHAWVRGSWDGQAVDPRLPMTGPGGGMSGTRRLTMAQALVEFLASQHSERDGASSGLFAGCFGIFGHGNVAGVGQALRQYATGSLPHGPQRAEHGPHRLRLRQAAATGWPPSPAPPRSARARPTWSPGRPRPPSTACRCCCCRATSSPPGSPRPCSSSRSRPGGPDVSANDAFRPVSRYWDRINRPDQLPGSLLEAMRVLTDPAETGAVTLALPQDVQTEAFDYPEELFERRVWHVARPVPEPAMLARAVEVLRGAPPAAAGGRGRGHLRRGHRRPPGPGRGDRRPGGRDLRRQGLDALRPPIGPGGHRRHRDRRGQRHGPPRPTWWSGVGTRWADFATASHSIFADPGSGSSTSTSPRWTPSSTPPPRWWPTPGRPWRRWPRPWPAGGPTTDWRQAAARHNRDWDAKVERVYRAGHGPLPSQGEVIGAVNDAAEPRDVVVCAAGSMPADLHKLWRTRDPKQFHLEYGNSCMGYEIPGAIGIRMADPSREVFAMVGDAGYLMNPASWSRPWPRGSGSSWSSSRTTATPPSGRCRRRRATAASAPGSATGRPTAATAGPCPVDLAANAASLGARVLAPKTVGELADALKEAREADGPVVVHVETDPLQYVTIGGAWWDVAVAEVSDAESVRRARADYERSKQDQRHYL